jgi:hypothetical protein
MSGADEASGNARRYLLGELPPDEEEHFEEQMLEDDALSDEVNAAEDALFDAFARDELSADQRSRFLFRFGDQEPRIASARELATATHLGHANVQDAASPEPRRLDELAAPEPVTIRITPVGPRRRRPGRWIVGTATVAVIATGAMLAHRADPPRTAPIAGAGAAVHTGDVPLAPAAVSSSVPSTTNDPTWQPPADVVELTISMSEHATSRSNLELSSGISSVVLRLRLDAYDAYPAYDVSLSRSDGAAVWSDRVMRAPGSANELVTTVPSQLFHTGEHRITVAGIAKDGARHELGTANVNVDLRTAH